MLKLSKKADYALIAVRHLAQHYANGESAAFSAADIAGEYHLSSPLMAKVLQRLSRHGLVVSRHGATGGYTLSRTPAEISALEVINAIDGPLNITSCVTQRGECDATERCTVREPLKKVNESILRVLGAVKISELTGDACESGIIAIQV